MKPRGPTISRRAAFPHTSRGLPRTAQGGIRAQSRPGRFGERWWGQRWLQVLESLLDPGRLRRGRVYARRGQVLNLQVEPGRVQAEVQGSRANPYRVRIEMRPFDAGEIARLKERFSQQALFAAKLLAGELPREMEPAFVEAGLPLFPERADDLQTACSCPDAANPCKHIAAVYYLLSEELERDPFLLFTLRGLERDRLLSLAGPSASVPLSPQPGPPPEPTLATAAHFWTGDPLPAGWLGPVVPPPLTAPWLKRLGKFPLWRGAERFLEGVESSYVHASDRAHRLLFGRPPRRGRRR